MTLEFKSYFSGSTGNFNTLSDGKTKIALDFGVPINKAKKAMDYDLLSLDGILVTHLHRDHCKGVPKAIDNAMDCYALESVFKDLGLSGHRAHKIKAGVLFEIGTFKILPFGLQHDVQNVGFLIQSGSEKFIYITDTHYCKFKFVDLTMIAIECNYSKEILDENLKLGLIHPVVRNRVIKSHFELENVKEFLKANDLSNVREIHLLHLSGLNSDRSYFIEEIQKLTGKPVYV